LPQPQTKHDGRVNLWCTPCRSYVVVQASAVDNHTVRVTPRRLEDHRASEVHTAALAALRPPRRRRGRRGGKGRNASQPRKEVNPDAR
jgi:hypothetical protein